MPFPTMPSAAADREDEAARRNPERETLELATAGAAKVLGPDHGVTKALARASITMAKAEGRTAIERAESRNSISEGQRDCFQPFLSLPYV